MRNMIEKIRATVDEFSKRHNVACQIDDPRDPREIGAKWPLGRHKGCYAFVSQNGELLYVGCGAMPTSSIGTRLNWHIRKKPVPDGAVALMIATEPWYGAFSLEAFLIDGLSPQSNKVGRSLLSRL